MEIRWNFNTFESFFVFLAINIIANFLRNVNLNKIKEILHNITKITKIIRELKFLTHIINLFRFGRWLDAILI